MWMPRSAWNRIRFLALTNDLRTMLGINGGIDTNSATYTWSYRGGVVYGTVVSTMAGQVPDCQINWAVKGVQYYGHAMDAKGIVESSYHLGHGTFDASDAMNSQV
jgi:hypothetical protein